MSKEQLLDSKVETESESKQSLMGSLRASSDHFKSNEYGLSEDSSNKNRTWTHEIVRSYMDAGFNEHTPFHSADKETRANGLSFCEHNYQVLIGQDSKVLQFDLQMGTEPVKLYEHDNEEEDFYFEILPEAKKLMIFSKEKIEVIDLADDNKVVATKTNEDLELEEVYPTVKIDNFPNVTFQVHVFDTESSMVMLTNTKLFLFNLDKLQEDGLVVSHTRGLAKDKDRFHHSYLNLDNRTLVVNQGDKGKYYTFWEVSLDNFKFKRQIGVKQKLATQFYFHEPTRKVFIKSQTLAEMKVHYLNRNLTSLLQLESIDDISGQDCRIIVDQEQGLIYSGGLDCFTVTDANTNMELTRMPITGTVKRLIFSPDKSRLLVSVLSEDQYHYYDYDIYSLGRFYYRKTGKMFMGNQVSNPLSKLVYFIHQREEDQSLSLRYFDCTTKLQSDALIEFKESVQGMLVDPYDEFIYVALAKESPLIIKKINLSTLNVVCELDTSNYCEVEGSNKSAGQVDLIYIEKQRHNDMIYVKQKLQNQETEKFIRVQLTLECSNLDVITQESSDGTKKQQYIISEFIEERSMLFIARIDTKYLQMLDFGDINNMHKNQKLIRRDITQLSVVPRTIRVSPKDKYVSVGLQDGSVIVYLVNHLCDLKDYQYVEYNLHRASIHAQTFIETKEGYQLASLDKQGFVSVYSLADKQLLFMCDPPESGLFYKGFLYHNLLTDQLLVLRGEYHNKDAETIELGVKKDQIEKNLSFDIQETINKRFLMEKNPKKQKIYLKFLKQDPCFLANKLNLSTFAAILGQYQQMNLIPKLSPILLTLEGRSLVEICLESGDINAFDSCLRNMTISDMPVTCNMKTLGYIISSQPQEASIEFLSTNLVREAVFNEHALKLLPIKGEIKEDYLQTDEITLTPCDLNYAVELDPESMQNLNIYSLQAAVSTSLSSPDCLNYLEQYLEADDEHLQIPQTSLYVDALWDFNWNVILMYYLINIIQFLVIVFTVCLAPTNLVLFKINAVFSLIMILNESRQICVEGLSYFKEAFNYLDISGNVFMIWSMFNLINDGENEFYFNHKNNRILILGILLVGLRAYSNLRIFENYRVQIQLFKQIMVDIFWFMSILMMLILLMAIVFGVENVAKVDKNADVKPAKIGGDFTANIGLFYQFMLGENPYGDDKLSTTSWLIYVIFTMLVQVIALNLLIAILSETFANVYATMDANHSRTKVDILLEISGLKCIYRKAPEAKKFLHFVKLSSEKYSDQSESKQMQERMETLTTDVETLKDMMVTMNENILEMKSRVNQIPIQSSNEEEQE